VALFENAAARCSIGGGTPTTAAAATAFVPPMSKHSCSSTVVAAAAVVSHRQSVMTASWDPSSSSGSSSRSRSSSNSSSSRSSRARSSTASSNSLRTALGNKYNGDAIEAHYAARPWEVTDRLANIGPPLVAWWVQTQVDNRTRNFVPEKVAHAFNTARAAELKDLLAKSGSVTFIKSGQALSLRQDLVKNAEYVRELTKLQDEVGTFPNAVAMQIIEVFDTLMDAPYSALHTRACQRLQRFCVMVKQRTELLLLLVVTTSQSTDKHAAQLACIHKLALTL
jgi:hypothetical protein